MNPFIHPSYPPHQYKISSSLKQKMRTFTNLITEQNSTRYDYIQMLQNSYGALLTEQSKTQHFCDICKKTIYGKAFGPHKKSHYKNGENNKQKNNNGSKDDKNNHSEKENKMIE